MEQRRDRRTSSSMRNLMEVQPTRSTSLRVRERLVRKCKKAMYAVLGNRSFIENVLSTTMCIVEQTLNARPLTPVSSDVNDLEALTPNHFLLQERLITLPNLGRRICGSSKALSINSSICKSHMGQISERTSANSE